MENEDFESKLSELIQSVISNDYISIDDIPSIDLYMDQITTFMEDRLGSFKRNPEDKILTKTMINNYTKDQLLPPPQRKKYSKNHMLLLLMIYHFKSVLSIGDIKTVLDAVSLTNLPLLYESLCGIQTNVKESLSVFLETINSHDNLHEDETQSLINLVFILISKADLEKRLAEEIIDTYFKSNAK